MENGATLRNAILGNNGVDGVHFYNGGNLQNFRWTNVGEDAFTVKSSGTVNISGVTGFNGEDKFGQINAAGTVNISNCIVDSVAKVIRQNGGTTFKTTVNIDRCQLSNLGEGVFRSDSSSSVAQTDQQPSAQQWIAVHRLMGELHGFGEHELLIRTSCSFLG